MDIRTLPCDSPAILATPKNLAVHNLGEFAFDCFHSVDEGDLLGIEEGSNELRTLAIVRTENRISVFFKSKITRDPLAFVACHCRDGKPRIRVSGGVGCAPDVRSFNRAVLHFCPWAEAVERAT